MTRSEYEEIVRVADLNNLNSIPELPAEFLSMGGGTTRTPARATTVILTFEITDTTPPGVYRVTFCGEKLEDFSTMLEQSMRAPGEIANRN